MERDILWDEDVYYEEPQKSEGPAVQMINVMGMPFLLALLSTLILMIPKFENFPLIGYFKRTVGFVSVVSWLTTFILFIVMTNAKSTLSIKYKSQTLMVTSILIAAVLFGMIFSSTKPSKTTESVVMGIKNAYSERMTNYLATDLSLKDTDTYFSDTLDLMISPIMRMTESEMSSSDKDSILTTVYDSASGKHPFVKVHKVLYELNNQYPSFAYTADSSDPNGHYAIITYFLGYDSTTDLSSNPTANDALVETQDYIKELKELYDTTADKVILDESVKKINTTVCGNDTIDWDSLASVPADITTLRTDLNCPIPTTSFEQFTQKNSSTARTSSTASNQIQNTSRQDIIDFKL